jgi:hypothetical protein
VHLERGRATADILAELRAEAERTWGAERAAALAATLESAANALGRLAQAPFDLLEVEPDFIGDGRRQEGAH